MKSFKLYMAGFGVLSALSLLSSCKRELDPLIEEDFNLAHASQVQVYNSTIGSTARTWVFMDGKPVTGAALTYGTSFPASAYAFTVPAGLRAFVVRDTLTTSAQQPLVFSENFQASKNYTVFTYDTSTAPKQITVETKIESPADSTSRIRFANFIYNKVAMPGLDIYSARKKANIFTNVLAKDVTNFIPHLSGVSDTFYVRLTGSTTNFENIGASPGFAKSAVRLIFTPTQKRSYTVVFRGGYLTDTLAKASVRTLTFFANK